MTHKDPTKDECRYCANTGWFYGDSDLGLCGCWHGGRRSMLNDLLAPNQEVSAKLAELEGREPDPEGRIHFAAVFWITAVAQQQGIKSIEESKDDS